jgi:hypothetical protein
MKMSEVYECEKARHRYLKFLQDLDACQPKFTRLFEPDSHVEEFVEVERTEALNCFLRKYPSYERFRDELAKVRRDVRTFLFNPESWKAQCAH